MEHFFYIKNYPKIELGILTGDVVQYGTTEQWEAAIADIDSFNMPIHIAAGNHDRGTIFEEMFDYYYAFQNGGDLFIILSPTDWNIAGTQKDFLMATLENQAPLVNNVFVFCHELIWWAPDNEFGNVEINYRPHYPGSTNYWEEVSPMLESIDNDVVIYAGDLGAKPDVASYMYYQYENITLIASGMGGGVEDNIIITEVGMDGRLKFSLLGLNGSEPYELGKLEEYELP